MSAIGPAEAVRKMVEYIDAFKSLDGITDALIKPKDYPLQCGERRTLSKRDQDDFAAQSQEMPPLIAAVKGVIKISPVHVINFLLFEQVDRLEKLWQKLSRKIEQLPTTLQNTAKIEDVFTRLRKALKDPSLSELTLLTKDIAILAEGANDFTHSQRLAVVQLEFSVKAAYEKQLQENENNNIFEGHESPIPELSPLEAALFAFDAAFEDLYQQKDVSERNKTVKKLIQAIPDEGIRIKIMNAVVAAAPKEREKVADFGLDHAGEYLDAVKQIVEADYNQALSPLGLGPIEGDLPIEEL